MISQDEEQSNCKLGRAGPRTDIISERYIEMLEGGFKESQMLARSPQERLDEEIGFQTFLAEKRCKKFYLKETIVSALQSTPQLTLPPDRRIFNTEYCSVWQHRCSHAPQEKIQFDSGYHIFVPKFDETNGQAADPECKPDKGESSS